MPRLSSCGALLLALAFVTATPLTGQQSRAPFRTIGLTATVSGNVNRNAFHERWLPGTGFGAAVELPFYAGHAELGAEQVRFESRLDGVPGFRARYLFIGWAVEALPSRPSCPSCPSRFSWRNGLRLGSYGMRFDDPALPTPRRHESEIGVELASRLGWSPIGRWQLSLSGQYRVVLTEPVIRHIYATAAITRIFTTPRWLRDFLD